MLIIPPLQPNSVLNVKKILAVINAAYAVAKRKPEKIRLAGIRTLTSAIPVQRSNQLSYQANWELVIKLVRNIPGKDEELAQSKSPASFFGQEAASCLLFLRQSQCWRHLPDLKHQFQKSILEVTRFVKNSNISTARKKATNFGPVLPNPCKRLRSVCYSIGEVDIICSIDLCYNSGVKACSKYTSTRYYSLKLYCQGKGDMGQERHWLGTWTTKMCGGLVNF